MIRSLFFFLAFLFLAALPRYLTSPWFDDEYVGLLHGGGMGAGMPVRVTFLDSSPIRFRGKAEWATLTMSAEQGHPFPPGVSSACIMRSVVFSSPEMAEIELAPTRKCPHTSFSVRFDGFSNVVIDLGGGRTVSAEREYRRNPVHLAAEWLKWRFWPQSGVFFNSKGL
jgi:hypothetical protein